MSTDAYDDAPAAWTAWQRGRLSRVTAPTGSLALTGTHWLTPGEDVEVPGVPGTWRADGAVAWWTTADGRTEVHPDTADDPTDPVAGRLRLVLIEREGELAVRVYDPASPALAAFDGIDVAPYDPAWVVEATWTPYDDARVVPVLNADGRERGLALHGTLRLRLPAPVGGGHHALAAEQVEDGSLWLVLRDATGADGTAYPFRFLAVPAPDARGRTTADLNRAYLPPCAFADHFVCPMPPPGNTLAVPVLAGELAVSTSAALPH